MYIAETHITIAMNQELARHQHIMRTLNQQQQMVYAAMVLDSSMLPFNTNKDDAEAMTVGRTLKTMFADGALSSMRMLEDGSVVVK